MTHTFLDNLIDIDAITITQGWSRNKIAPLTLQIDHSNLKTKLKDSFIVYRWLDLDIEVTNRTTKILELINKFCKPVEHKINKCKSVV